MPDQQFLEFEDLLFEADELIRNNKIADAINLLEGIIAEVPDFGKAYNHLGWVYETKLKDLSSAEAMYKQCMAYNPDYPPVYLNLSIVLSALGKYEELEKHLNLALTINGVEKSTIYNEIAILHELKQEYDLAIDNFKQAIKFTLSEPNVDTYAKSIERCRKKRELLKD